MRNRVNELHYKKEPTYENIDFSRIRVGAKQLDDAIMQFSELKKVNPKMADKQYILKSIQDNDLPAMREISMFFYKTSGIYSRMLRYMAFIYRYDWFVTPYVNDESVKKEKLLKSFNESVKTLDRFGVKKTLGEIALKVLQMGCYYGYKVDTSQGLVLQELPQNFCRSRFYAGRKPAVEFNMKFFDVKFRDTEQRMRVLKLFPEEFMKGYRLYKQGKLPPAFQGDSPSWYLLDPEQTVKFTANGEDYPMFISVIPLLLDLEEARALDRQKTAQRLIKILVQKIPLDKNGDLIFDPEEIQQLHNNAVQMISRSIGLEILTTFGDTSVADMSDKNNSTQNDDLLRIERQVYNESGVSQKQFNTDGNLALEKSIMNDEATMYNLLLQFEDFLNELVIPFNNGKKMEFRVSILTTTIYNYKELAKLYKEQTQLGYSKMLPQIALGQSQSSILANVYFENDILDLVNVFIPPLMSSTVNADILNRKQGGGEEGKSGRTEKPDDQKSEKTIQNRESMS